METQVKAPHALDLSFQFLEAEDTPEVLWEHDDDLCDCTFQRLGFWTNPYLGQTMRVRFCCIWAEIVKDYPQFVEEVSHFYNYNEDKYEDAPREWDAEFDMPRAIWYRQLATKTGKPLDYIRHAYHDAEPPKGKPKPVKKTRGGTSWKLR